MSIIAAKIPTEIPNKLAVTDEDLIPVHVRIIQAWLPSIANLTRLINPGFEARLRIRIRSLLYSWIQSEGKWLARELDSLLRIPIAVKSSYFRAPMPASGTHSASTCLLKPCSAISSPSSSFAATWISGKSYSSSSDDCGICIRGRTLCCLGGEYRWEMNFERGFCGDCCCLRLKDIGLDLWALAWGGQWIYSTGSSNISCWSSWGRGGDDVEDEADEASTLEEEPYAEPLPFIMSNYHPLWEQHRHCDLQAGVGLWVKRLSD